MPTPRTQENPKPNSPPPQAPPRTPASIPEPDTPIHEPPPEIPEHQIEGCSIEITEYIAMEKRMQNQKDDPAEG